MRFKFKPGTVIPSRSTLFVSPDVKAFRGRSVSPRAGERRFVTGPYDGSLSALGETINLTDTSGRLVSSKTFAGDPTLNQLQFVSVNEGYRLRYCGTPDRVCEVQRSSDLVQWHTVLKTPIPPSGILEHFEPFSTDQAAYYRAVQH